MFRVVYSIQNNNEETENNGILQSTKANQEALKERIVKFSNNHPQKRLILSCPHCGEKVIYATDDKNISYFKHHRTTEQCNYQPESSQHKIMKQSVYSLFVDMPEVNGIEFEMSLVPGRVADALITFKNGRRMVVECQTRNSNILLSEWEARTQEYTDVNTPVLWAWDSLYVGVEKIPKENIFFEREIDHQVLMASYFDHSRLLVVDHEGEAAICRLKKSEVKSYAYFDDNGDFYEPSKNAVTTKEPVFSRLGALSYQQVDIASRTSFEKASKKSNLLLGVVKSWD